MAQQNNKQQHPQSISQELHEINEDLMIDEAQLYAGPKGQLRQWFDEGAVKEADFMVVARDGFDNTLFPVYIDTAKFPDRQNTAETVRGLEAGGDKAMEVYDLHADRESQILAPRTWNNEQARSEPARSQGAYQVPTRNPGQPSGGAVSGAPAVSQADGAAASRGTSSQAGLSSFNGGRTRSQPATAVSPGSSSQAGLSSYVGGQAKSLPSVPPPGQPGSRFNPVVVNREKQASRRSAGKKSLAIGTPPGLIEGIPPEIKNPRGSGPGQDPVAETDNPGVISAATGGFTGGFAAGAQEALNVTGAARDVTEIEVPETAAPGNKVVMNPAHLARLEALDGRRNESLENSGGHYGR